MKKTTQHLKKKNGLTIGSLNSTQNSIFFEGFEDAWPGQWSVGDINSNNGYDYWGDFDYTSYTGWWSVWCADEGDMEPGEKYDDNMDAYMTMTQGVDLTNYQNTYLTYNILYDTEINYDYFERYESTDGINWELKERYEGNGGWDSVNVAIPSGGMYYAKFVFFSDGSNSTYDGVYIDDIEITGDPTYQPKPNLTYDFSYSWDGAIVISKDTGTNIDTDVYGGQITYIDWGIINYGDTASGPFTVNLEIDGFTDTIWTINNLNANGMFSIKDFKRTLSTGFHSVGIDIDPLNQVDESDELDNWYEKGYSWLASEISFSGTVNHLDLNTATGLQIKKSAGIKVQLMDKNTPADRILAETTTNSDGNFFFDNISNVDTDTTNLDIYIKLYADNNAAYVTTNLGGNITTDISPVYNNIPPGSYDTAITVNSQMNDYFFVANIIYEARNKWLQLRPQNQMGQVEVVVSSIGAGTKYDNNAIWIESSINNQTWYPDTYDKDIINHEYTHRIQDIHDFFDYGGGYHDWMDTSDVMVAAQEALAHVLPCILRDDGSSLILDYYNNFSQNSFINMESGEYGHDNIVDASANNFGNEVEASVAGILWDIYDSQDDDYSTYGSSTYPNLSNPDGIGDNLSSQTTKLFNTLLDKNINGHHPDNIDEFWDAWFSSPSYGYDQEMEAIWYEHGILNGCCIGIRGNIDGDSEDIIDISDMLYLLDFMFRQPNGPAPVCFEEADLNGSSGIDIADLVYFIEYMFKGGAAPISCY